MSIISTRKSAVHPVTTRRPGRTFGEGILDPTPTAGATAPRPFHPTPAESAWLLAFDLAAAGDDAAAPAGSTADVLAAWEEGTLHGGREFDARMDLASERALLLDRMCGQDIPHGEWMEARIVPPVR